MLVRVGDGRVAGDGVVPGVRECAGKRSLDVRRDPTLEGSPLKVQTPVRHSHRSQA